MKRGSKIKTEKVVNLNAYRRHQGQMAQLQAAARDRVAASRDPASQSRPAPGSAGSASIDDACAYARALTSLLGDLLITLDALKDRRGDAS